MDTPPNSIDGYHTDAVDGQRAVADAYTSGGLKGYLDAALEPLGAWAIGLDGPTTEQVSARLELARVFEELPGEVVAPPNVESREILIDRLARFASSASAGEVSEEQIREELLRIITDAENTIADVAQLLVTCSDVEIEEVKVDEPQVA